MHIFKLFQLFNSGLWTEFFWKMGQITKFLFSNIFGLFTCSAPRMYQNYFFWGHHNQLIMDVSVCRPGRITDVIAHSSHMLTNTDQLHRRIAATHFFSLLKSCKVINPNAHGIHIITVETRNYLNKIIYNTSSQQSRWIHPSIAWEGLVKF